jgi:hypothetical protein
MSLVGAVLTTSISLMIPALMHLSISSSGQELTPLGAAGAVAALVLGAALAVVGATSAVGALQEKLAAAAAAACVA